MIAIGDPAPDFELPDQDGPGCTTQACGVRDHLPDYDRAGAVVLGASPDPVAKVKRFHDKQGLNFRLLADEDHSVADTYGVRAEKSMYGKTYCPKTHDEQVLAVLAEM
jgi:peroxiredoxin Q/BCP